MYAHDDSGGKHVETHLCSHAADEIERLREALIQIRAVCEDNPNMAHNFIDEVARKALNPAQEN